MHSHRIKIWSNKYALFEMAGTRSPSPATAAQPCTGQSFGEADPLLA